jgi:hypothetical protein
VFKPRILTKPFLALQANRKPSAALVSFDQALKISPLKHRKSSSNNSFVLFSMGAWSKDTSAALGRVSCIWNQVRLGLAKIIWYVLGVIFLQRKTTKNYFGY